jgi:rRNA maturation protein Nop10
MKMVLKKCPYCGNDYPVRDDIERCPTCGGDLKLHRTALAQDEKKFSMDEEDDTGVS